MTDTRPRPVVPPSPPAPDRQIHARIRAEFAEMPGMRLTLPQAARLFNLELTQCRRALQTLVEAGAIWTDGRQFLGSNVGRRHV